jgi:diguanylate cyclase (GGDEF)-like protein
MSVRQSESTLQPVRLSAVAGAVAEGESFTRVAADIAEGLANFGCFTAAVVAARDGDVCRVTAASGAVEATPGATTPYDRWRDSLTAETARTEMIHAATPPEAAVRRTRPSATDATGAQWWMASVPGETDEPVAFVAVDVTEATDAALEEALGWLEAFACQAQLALGVTTASREPRRRANEANAHRTVGQALAESLELPEVLARCCDAAVSNSVADRATAYLYNAGADTFVPMMSRGIRDPDAWERFHQLKSVDAGKLSDQVEAVRNGKAVLIPDVAATDSGQHPEVELFDVKSLALYPLLAGGSFVGILALDAFRDRVEFDDREMLFMRELAGQAALAIQQAQLHAEARRRAATTAQLYDVAKTLAGTLDFDTVFEQIAEAVSSRLGALGASIIRVEGQHVEVVRAESHRGEPPPQPSLPLDDTLADFAVRLAERRTVIIPDVADWPELRRYTRPETRTLLLAAHLEQDYPAIALSIGHAEPDAFDAEDEAFAAGLVDVAATGLHNAELYEQARLAADRDNLTGLRNRRVFWNELGEHLDAEASERSALAVVDIDGFKAVNDAHGHGVGDRVLAHVADRLARRVRETDTVYRVGGEEFAVLMPGADPDNASEVMAQVADGLRSSRRELPVVSLSAGIAGSRPDESGEQLFGRADAAMYEAKQTGKDRVVVDVSGEG